jgi:hypothetical protein
VGSRDLRQRIVRLWRRPVADVSPEVEATRPCPHCHSPISRGATVCLHCEQEIAPLLSYGEFARRFGSPHAGGPPHARPDEDPAESSDTDTAGSQES